MYILFFSEGEVSCPEELEASAPVFPSPELRDKPGTEITTSDLLELGVTVGLAMAQETSTALFWPVAMAAAGTKV